MPFLALQKCFHRSIGSTLTPRQSLEITGCVLWEFHQVAHLLKTSKLFKNTEKRHRTGHSGNNWHQTVTLLDPEDLLQGKNLHTSITQCWQIRTVFHNIWKYCAIHQGLKLCIHQVHLSCPTIHSAFSSFYFSICTVKRIKLKEHW